MDHPEIIARCKAIEDRALELGFFSPSVWVRLNWLDHAPIRLTVMLRTTPNYEVNATISEDFDAFEDIEPLFDQALTWLDEQESPTQIRVRATLHKLSEVVEALEDLDLEVDTAPLREVFTTMTTNLLEHHRAN